MIIEGWHWIRDTHLHEDAHRYRGNGAGVMATLQSAALNLLRLAGFQSIRAGILAVMHDTRRCWRWPGGGLRLAHAETLKQPRISSHMLAELMCRSSVKTLVLIVLNGVLSFLPAFGMQGLFSRYTIRHFSAA